MIENVITQGGFSYYITILYGVTRGIRKADEAPLPSPAQAWLIYTAQNCEVKPRHGSKNIDTARFFAFRQVAIV
ncbi:MAG: hypothetical protein EXQ84_05330 [Rhodospirillaceae bacterium]|nr:hypothetical protein [Rhodospirillaceae bacterium]